VTPEEVLAGIVARRKSAPPPSSTRGEHGEATDLQHGCNTKYFQPIISASPTKSAEPAEPSLLRDGGRGQDAPAAETLPGGPFAAVCAWLFSLHLAPEHEKNTRTDRSETPEEHPIPGPPCPPYVLRLVALLERIGDGTADDTDRQRLRSWLPNGIFNARLVHRRDPAACAVLLAELGVLT